MAIPIFIYPPEILCSTYSSWKAVCDDHKELFPHWKYYIDVDNRRPEGGYRWMAHSNAHR